METACPKYWAMMRMARKCVVMSSEERNSCYLTPGCTTQACNLRDNYETLKKEGYEVLGVSINDGKTHQKFIAKHTLPFHLIADTEATLAQQFGVWGEKKMYGRTYMGTLRTTFIVNAEGIIERILTPKEVKVGNHAAQILKTSLEP